MQHSNISNDNINDDSNNNDSNKTIGPSWKTNTLSAKLWQTQARGQSLGCPLSGKSLLDIDDP